MGSFLLLWTGSTPPQARFLLTYRLFSPAGPPPPGRTPPAALSPLLQGAPRRPRSAPARLRIRAGKRPARRRSEQSPAGLRACRRGGKPETRQGCPRAPLEPAPGLGNPGTSTATPARGPVRPRPASRTETLGACDQAAGVRRARRSQ